MKTNLRSLLLGAGLVLATTGAFAQTSDSGKPADAGKPVDSGKPADPGVHGKGSVESDAVRTLLKGFEAKRDAYIAERQALVAKLQGATDAERKTILDELRAEQKARIDDQRALAKQIRDELKKLREQRKSGSGG